MTYGFIAQELEEVLSCVVRKSKDKIPNVMKIADVIDGVFTLEEATDLIEGDKIAIFDEDDTELRVKITELISDKQFKVETDEELKDKYFIYGKFVDDFQSVEHNCLLPIMIKGIQELNAKNKSLEERANNSLTQLIVGLNGNVGIGNTNPLVPLHVYSSNNFQTNDSGISGLTDMGSINYIAHHVQPHKVDTHNFTVSSHDISIYAEGTIFSGTYIGASDKRIKKNITEIDDERSLVQLRNLPCVDYDYVDNFKNGEYKTVGFIAQDVKEIMPNCVETVSDIIPNEMRLLENLEWEPVVKDISSNESGYKLINQELEEASYKFFVKDFSSNEKPLEVSYPFIFEKKWDEVFCYGKRVNDFLAIDKNKIFALGFSATQQIDRIQQKHIIDISNIKRENTELKREIIQLTTDISMIRKHIGI